MKFDCLLVIMIASWNSGREREKRRKREGGRETESIGAAARCDAFAPARFSR